MNLFNVISVEKGKQLLEENFKNIEIETEKVPILESRGRIIAKDIYSDVELPHFNRSTVDGYAVRSTDTYGASVSIPAILDNVGTVEMGVQPKFIVAEGTCVYVPTGGMLPEGTDSVVMIEYSEEYGDGSIGLNRSVATLENTIQRGSDISLGDVIIYKGTKIKASHIGALASIGVTTMEVYKPIVISVISTGDEIVPPNQRPSLGQIRDINTYTLSELAKELGCEVREKIVVKDDYNELLSTVRRCIEISDIVLISGGSSVGDKDYTARVINDCGNPGVLAHGLAIKPGKPTIIGNVNGKPVIGMPGQPVSAMIVFRVLINHLIKTIRGELDRHTPYIIGELSQNIPSAPGRETYQMVQTRMVGDRCWVKPLYGKSGMISLISNAYGFITIGSDSEGVRKGEKVEVYRF